MRFCIIDKYNNWEEYSKNLSSIDKEYYRRVFSCAKKRKGVVVNRFLSEFGLFYADKDKKKEKELNIIKRYLFSFSLHNGKDYKSSEYLFDMFEMESRILCEYLQKTL